MVCSDLVRFTYYLFKSLGLAPITYREKKQFHRSIAGIFYNTILITCILAMSYVAIKLSVNERAMIVFDSVINIGYKTISGSIGIIILLSFIHHQNHIVNIANRLKDLHDLLCSSYNDTAKKFVKNTYILIMLSWLPMLLSLPIENLNNYEIAVYYIVTYICEAIVKGTIFQYIIILNFIKQLFETVNNHLNDVRQLKNPTKDQFSRLFRQHSLLIEMCEDLNEFYSIPVLSSTLFIFVTLILASYYVIKPLIFHTTELTLNLLLRCLATLIHELAILYYFTKTTSSVIKELHQFSTCLLHQNVKFSTAGLLSLDGSLLMSVIGSITTYMVILLQFQHQNSS
ncbi:uncharacterized protein LOC131669882 [Phymastichus coffea]|uniref:uncharacterized protein LOC131669882 n=1 Tax=Phymastichus coffea TaxID=108790 RepID=UPI00273C2340|nr:uncharacterized protein LOC131669882 [Phymastichus coffea]